MFEGTKICISSIDEREGVTFKVYNSNVITSAEQRIMSFEDFLKVMKGISIFTGDAEVEGWKEVSAPKVKVHYYPGEYPEKVESDLDLAKKIPCGQVSNHITATNIKENVTCVKCQNSEVFGAEHPRMDMTGIPITEGGWRAKNVDRWRSVLNIASTFAFWAREAKEKKDKYSQMVRVENKPFTEKKVAKVIKELNRWKHNCYKIIKMIEKAIKSFETLYTFQADKEDGERFKCALCGKEHLELGRGYRRVYKSNNRLDKGYFRPRLAHDEMRILQKGESIICAHRAQCRKRY